MKSKYFVWAVTITLLIVVALKLFYDYKDNYEIDANSATTEGEIIDYYIVGAHSPHLTYKYVIDGKEYKQTLALASKFRGCEENKDCIGRKFVVRYSIINPEKSKIDFNQELSSE